MILVAEGSLLINMRQSANHIQQTNSDAEVYITTLLHIESLTTIPLSYDIGMHATHFKDILKSCMHEPRFFDNRHGRSGYNINQQIVLRREIPQDLTIQSHALLSLQVTTRGDHYSSS